MTDEQQPPKFYIHTDDFVDADSPRTLQTISQTFPAIPDLFEKLENISNQKSDMLNQLISQVFNTPDIFEQAGQVQMLMQGLYKDAKWDITRLGQIITLARDRKLYSYLDQKSMNSWIQSCGIDLDMALKAEQLFANVNWFKEIDLPYQTVVGANRVQIEEISAFHAEVSTAIAQRVSTELPKSATIDERQKRFEELQQEQLPDIRARVQTIINYPTEGELTQALKKSAGTTVKAYLPTKITINPRTREVTWTGTLPLGDDTVEEDDGEEMFDSRERNVFSNISNGFQIKFFIEGEDDPISYIDLPEKVRELLDRKSMPSQQYLDRQRQQTQRHASVALNSTRPIDDRDYDPSDGDDDDGYNSI